MNENIQHNVIKLKNFINRTFSLLYKSIKKYYSLYLIGAFFIVIRISPYYEQLKYEMFKGRGGEIDIDTLMFLVSMLLTPIFLIYYIWPKNRNNRKKTSIVFLIMLYIYVFHIIKECIYPLTILRPQYFAPLLLSFLFFIKNTKHFNIYLLIFFSAPISIIVRDKIVTYNFFKICDAETPKAIFNPIYLPNEFFHEEIVDGKKILEPNIKDSTEIKNNKLFTKIENSTNATAKYIYIYGTCGVFKKGIFDKNEDMERLYETFTLLTNNKHIILCKDVPNPYGIEMRNGTYKKTLYEYTIEKINSDFSRTVLSQTYKMYAYTSSNKFINGSNLSCIYNPEEEKKPQRLNAATTIRNSEKDYRNFIKPLSEKPEPLGE